MPDLRVFDRLLSHAGLIHAYSPHVVRPHRPVQLRILRREGGAAKNDDFPRPSHVADFFQGPYYEQIAPPRDIDPDIDWPAAIERRISGRRLLDGRDKIICEKCRGLVDREATILLLPIIFVDRAPPAAIEELLPFLFGGRTFQNLIDQALSDRLENISLVEDR